jgi:hypothetical protein
MQIADPAKRNALEAEAESSALAANEEDFLNNALLEAGHAVPSAGGAREE